MKAFRFDANKRLAPCTVRWTFGKMPRAFGAVSFSAGGRSSADVPSRARERPSATSRASRSRMQDVTGRSFGAAVRRVAA